MEDKFKKYKDYKTILSVGALIWCDGKVLLLKRADTKKIDPGMYSGIGGKVEPGESIYDTLSREIEEETGITEFKPLEIYSITQHKSPQTDCEWVNFYFNVEITKQVQIPASEEGKFDWVDPKNIDKLPTVTDQKEYIKILSKNRNAFILGFFDNDKEGNPTTHKIHVF